MANDYDRILKENIGAVFLSLSEKYLGIRIIRSRALVGKLQHTLEREPDFIKVVETAEGKELILHLEFQLTNDPNMLRRMRTYHALLEEKYRLPVRQLVLYMGRKQVKMRTRFEPHEVMTGFELVDIQKMDAGKFLRSEIPEEIILAILSDFGNRSPLAVIRLILSRLREVDSDEEHFKRMVKQLGILSRIPKLEKEVKDEIKAMPITIDITKDAFYQEGKEKGLEEGLEEGLKKGLREGAVKEKETIAIKLLKTGVLSIEAISDSTGLPLSRIQSLQEEIKDQ